MPKPKTNAQIGRMFGLARKAEHGFDSDHDYLASLAAEVTGGRTSSLANLSFDEANAVIAQLGGDAFTTRGTSRRTINYHKQKAGIKTIETDAHLRKIEDLAARLGWDDARLRGFCQRQIKRDAPTTTEEGNKVLEGLKAMAARLHKVVSFPNPKSQIQNPKSAEPTFRRVA